MNLNAPEHRPLEARDVTVRKYSSDKFWSHPDEEVSKRIRTLVDDLKDLNAQRGKIEKARKSSGKVMRLPVFPLLSKTPLATESNVCKGTRINLSEGLYVLNPANGTVPKTTQATLEFICDYANKWHGSLSKEDYRSPGRVPRFFWLDDSFHTKLMSQTSEGMASEVSKLLPPKQFWGLRYLFIPIKYLADPVGQIHHVALCCISPETKSVDYLCSGNDSGLVKASIRYDGSKCIPALFCFLAAYLDLTNTPFMLNSWKFRGTASNLQDLLKGDCGLYTSGQAMYLAFGWGLAWPNDHQAKMPTRRTRFLQDLLLHGFAQYDTDSASKNWQYYPLLDAKSNVEKGEHFLELPKEVTDALPGWVVRRKECYLGCASKADLATHCRRNYRFYPDYLNRALDDRLGLKEFVQWVEECDWDRKTGNYIKGTQVLDYAYPDAVPKNWVDPRVATKQLGLEGLEEALWK